MTAAGMLLQVDGSRHDWLEGRGPWLTLVGGIDDATGLVTGAVFREQEDAVGYLAVLVQTAHRHGLPLALYSDRHGIFWKSAGAIPTLAEQFAGRRSTTQVGRALEGRDDRLGGGPLAPGQGPRRAAVGHPPGPPPERAGLAGAATLEDANLVLARYLPRHNARFAVPATDPGPAWRTSSRQPEALFCFRQRRQLAADGTLAVDGRSLALGSRPPGPAGRRWVVLQRRLDGSLWVEIEGTDHALVDAPPRATALRTSPEPRSRPQPPRPGPDHPWRRTTLRYSPR